MNNSEMEDINSKPSRIPIKSCHETALEKASTTPVPTASTHGIKLSMNMSSEAKREFLLKLEEWRKKKREMFIEKTCEVKKQNENHQSKPESIVTNNKEVKSVSSTGKKSVRNIQDRESVFERLYKNSKVVQNKGKENVETNKGNFGKKIDSTVPGLKKKNDILKAGTLQKNQNPTDRSFIASANTCELQSNVVVGDVGDIAENECNIDKIVVVTNNSPRATFVVTPKETPLTENLNSQTDFNNEEIISKTDELKVETVSLNSKEEATDTISSVNDLLLIKQEIKETNDSQDCTFEKKDNFEENLETLNKTFNVETNSDEIVDGVSQKSKKSETFIKPFLAKRNPNENKNCYGNSKLNEQKPQTSLRKSISSIYFQKCGIPQKATLKNVAPERNMHAVKPTLVKKEIDKVQFNKENKNPSVIKGIPPATPSHKKYLTSSCLRNKLEDWLVLNNHSLEGYRHLRCFGFSDNSNIVGQTPTKSTKKNITEKPIKSEASKIEEDDCNKENLLPPAPTEEVNLTDDQNRLKELYQLIVDLKYDPDRCEEWLIAIRKRNPCVTDLSIYWECLAALNQDNEDIKSAVEQYEKALADQDEKSSTDSSLAKLFDKLLIDQHKPNKQHKMEKGIDPKNIFRSTIIKFSLQKKVTKESTVKGQDNNSDCKYVATPVRRSSRLWTPQKNYVVNSLQSLTPEIRENVTFKSNDSLLN